MKVHLSNNHCSQDRPILLSQVIRPLIYSGLRFFRLFLIPTEIEGFLKNPGFFNNTKNLPLWNWPSFNSELALFFCPQKPQNPSYSLVIKELTLNHPFWNWLCFFKFTLSIGIHSFSFGFSTLCLGFPAKGRYFGFVFT